MVSCNPITVEKIRAEIYLGSELLAKTPNILSFNVNQSREQSTGTFSAQVRVKANLVLPLGGKLSIRAGTRGNLKTIYTGNIKQISPSPAFGMPGYVDLSINGRGPLSVLEDKKFSRRLKSDGQGMFCTITGAGANRPNAFYSISKKVNSGNQTAASDNLEPSRQGSGEHSPYIVAPGGGSDSPRGGASLSQIAGRPSGAGGTGGDGDGLGIHDHTDLDNGGPAYAVFSPD